jgi:deoxyinosine 3'endonuclease (endonuclease V)
LGANMHRTRPSVGAAKRRMVGEGSREMGLAREKAVDHPIRKTSAIGMDAQETAGGPGGDGNVVRRPRRQEQSCEGSNPMSDAATVSRG